jgi:catechol 2,3-dioxygenase-like lactoylglutathione lyase family enzyme
MHISLISLCVPHPEEVSAWYRTHLGLTVMATHPQTGRVVLATDEPGTSLILLPGESPDHPERIQLHFHVSDVDAMYAQLQAAGVVFNGPPTDMPWRWRHAYTHDPAGYTVELVTPLPDALLLN